MGAVLAVIINQQLILPEVKAEEYRGREDAGEDVEAFPASRHQFERVQLAEKTTDS